MLHFQPWHGLLGFIYQNNTLKLWNKRMQTNKAICPESVSNQAEEAKPHSTWKGPFERGEAQYIAPTLNYGKASPWLFWSWPHISFTRVHTTLNTPTDIFLHGNNLTHKHQIRNLVVLVLPLRLINVLTMPLFDVCSDISVLMASFSNKRMGWPRVPPRGLAHLLPTGLAPKQHKLFITQANRPLICLSVFLSYNALKNLLEEHNRPDSSNSNRDQDHKAWITQLKLPRTLKSYNAASDILKLNKNALRRKCWASLNAGRT